MVPMSRSSFASPPIVRIPRFLLFSSWSHCATTLLVGALLISGLAGCAADVISFARQDVHVRVQYAESGEPVPGALVALRDPSGKDVPGLRFPDAIPTNADGISVVTIEYAACFQSIWSLTPCDINKQQLIGAPVSIEARIGPAKLSGTTTLAENSRLADDTLVVTIVDIAPPSRVGVF